MRTMRVALAVMAVMAVTVAGGARAQENPPASPPGPGPRMGREMGQGPMMPGMGQAMAFGIFAPRGLIERRDELSLTPEQVSKLEGLEQEAQQARDKAGTDARAHWDQLAELWKQAAPDVAQIRTHAQAAMQTMQNAGLAEMVAAAQAKGVLTPEQRGRVAGWADARRERSRAGFQRLRQMRDRRAPGGPMRQRRGPPRPGRDGER